MEDFGDTRGETFDELVTKHTRRELEELALKYGVENLGGTKSQLADSILDAIKNRKISPRLPCSRGPKRLRWSKRRSPQRKRPALGNWA
jgi:hypothetical protein